MSKSISHSDLLFAHGNDAFYATVTSTLESHPSAVAAVGLHTHTPFISHRPPSLKKNLFLICF